MKKKLLGVLLMVGTVAYAPAQEKSEVAQTPGTCEYVPVSHWSLGIKGGANYFRVAPSATKRLNQINPIIGGTLEYSINPLVGIGLEYNYNDYSHSYYKVPANGDLDGGTHDAVLYGSVNLANLLTPYRTGFWSKLNVYGDGGVGLAFYHFNIDNGNYTSDDISTAPTSGLAKIGINAEYNLSKSFALGIEGQYRYYDRSTLGGYSISRGHSDALVATIGLRYKFGAKGSKQHARNISMCEYYPRPVPVIINKTTIEGDTKETLNRLSAVEQENATLKQKLQKMEDDLKLLSTQNEGVVNASFQNIEFKFGLSELTEASYPTLDQIAILLKKNPSWSRLNVTGYTDNIGTNDFNQTLSEARANVVKDYLLSKGVTASSITTRGDGENNPIATNDTPEGRQQNRRVEFEITKVSK